MAGGAATLAALANRSARAQSTEGPKRVIFVHYGQGTVMEQYLPEDDGTSLTLPFICFGLYSSLPLQVVQILASFPFLLMIFFSTTFSPGAGVAGVKSLRYLFSRFYFWCALEAHSQGRVHKWGVAEVSFVRRSHLGNGLQAFHSPAM